MRVLCSSLFCIIGLCVSFYARTRLFWLCSIFWVSQPRSFCSRLFWLLEVTCGSIWISELFFSFCEEWHWYVQGECIEPEDFFQWYEHFNNVIISSISVLYFYCRDFSLLHCLFWSILIIVLCYLFVVSCLFFGKAVDWTQVLNHILSPFIFEFKIGAHWVVWVGLNFHSPHPGLLSNTPV